MDFIKIERVKKQEESKRKTPGLKLSSIHKRNQTKGSITLDDQSVNSRSLRKYQDIAVRLLSEREFIISEEYLNDDSYLDFKNSLNISVSCTISSKPKLKPSKQKKINTEVFKASKSKMTTTNIVE